jgi:hypothetical protein
MKKQKKHLRRLPKDKRCFLRILVFVDSSLGVIHKVLIFFGFDCVNLRLVIYLIRKSDLGMLLKIWSLLLL